MSLAVHPDNLRIYRELLALAWKHGHRPTLQQLGLFSDGDQTEADDTTHPANPQAFAEDVEALGPTFVKLAQVIASQSNFLPSAHAAALTRLQDDVEARPFAEMRRVIEDELGRSIHEAFERIEPEPLGSASLGQVYRATIKVDGENQDVAVKVLRPEAAEAVDRELGAVHHAATTADKITGDRYRFADLLEHSGSLLRHELDLRREADHLERFAIQLQSQPSIATPRVFRGWSGQRVLTMSLHTGVSVDHETPATDKAAFTDDGSRLADEVFRAYLHHILIDGFFHADPHPGNVRLERDSENRWRVVMLDLGRVGRLGPDLREKLLRLVAAISEGEAEKAARIALRIGEPGRETDHSAFRRAIGNLVLQHAESSVARLPLGEIVLGVGRVCGEFDVRIPPVLATIGTTLVHLEAVGGKLDPDFNPRASIEAELPRILWRHASGQLRLARYVDPLLEARQLIETLPTHAHRLLETLSRDDRGFRIDAIDEDRLIDGFEKIANRIAVGVVLAALLLAGAIVMTATSPGPVLLGLPVISWLAFIAAAFGGTLLFLGAWWRDRG